jgi:hypothetical protein
VEAGSGAFTLGPDTEAQLVFGCCDGLGGNPFNGALDEVRIYSKVLSADEVGELAALGDPVVEPFYSPALYGPMRLHAELEGDLTDSTANANDGTMVGGDPVFEAGAIGQAIHLDVSTTMWSSAMWA